MATLSDLQISYIRDKFVAIRDRCVTAVTKAMNAVPTIAQAIKGGFVDEANTANVLSYYVAHGAWPQVVGTGDEYELFTNDSYEDWQKARTKLARVAAKEGRARIKAINGLFDDSVDSLILGDNADAGKVLKAFTEACEAL